MTLHRLPEKILFAASLLSVTIPANAQTPQWIWHPDPGQSIKPGEIRFFRKTFNLATVPAKASLQVAADDEATVYINGKKIVEGAEYTTPRVCDVTKELVKGKNVIAIKGHNIAADTAGVIAILELKGRKPVRIMTDESWRTAQTAPDTNWVAATFDDSPPRWVAAKSKGKHGDQPWGEVFKTSHQATAAEAISVAPGFKVELVRSSALGEGSWICMTVDDKGRLIISPQADNEPLLRLTVRGNQVEKVETIPAPIHQAMGLLYAHKSLYASAHGPNGTGLYRLIDSNHNDVFETNELHFLKTFAGEGEHGYHAVVLGPDQMIYVMNGNHTKLPQGLATNSPHKNFQEDFLLPRQWDAGGHAVGIMAPGGHILRTDPEGKHWELMLAGFRNTYDFDFNSKGEIFGFDSDMEWDWGLPWYRPTKVFHCVAGGEYGWRSGSAVWPDYFPDSLPAAANIGLGSPTGVKFGIHGNFPEPYRSALFLLDWSYGRLFAVHLKPTGASYVGDFEVIAHGKPLNLTDLEFGKDGSMYFITGGRGTQSGLYRLTYVGAPPAPSSSLADTKETKNARALRHKLESYYGRKDPGAVNFAWPYLGNPDRFLAYAARIAIEWQDVALWKDRALHETNPDAALNALLALARCGEKQTQKDLLMALTKFPFDSLSRTQKLAKLRIIGLSFIRQGKPDFEVAAFATTKLDRLYPSNDDLLDRELSQILIFLESTNAISKTLALLDKAKTQEDQIHYIFHLRNLQKGWTIDQRKHYFDMLDAAIAASKGAEASRKSPFVASLARQHPAQLVQWFKEADRDYSDGASYPKYLLNIRKDAEASLSGDERVALWKYLDNSTATAAHKPTRQRTFVKTWTMVDLEPELSKVSHGRNFASGKAAFNDAQCMMCHRFVNEGGSIGPELTAVSSKYSRRDIIESIIEPSKVISEQFQNTVVSTTSGDSEIGRLVDENDKVVVLQPSLLAPDRVTIKKSEIKERHPSTVSPMPEGLLTQLTLAEILDMLAYIETAGKEKAPNFKPVAAARK
jgi:putative heme-binding domain-containing protein